MPASIIPVPDFDCVVFGATGDLTLRKLLPALYYRFCDKQFGDNCRIIAAARSKLSVEEYRKRATEALSEHVKKTDQKAATLKAFLQRLEYVSVNGATEDGWDELCRVLAEGADKVRVFYLATSPNLYGTTCQNLKKHGVITENSRVVLEKPIGHDLASAKQINDEVGAVFKETQIFRIDHYLGKETVQNLLALRFANVIFERLWNSDCIDHVQITVAETVGVESRGDYYDHSGALRDMVQNHLMQLLCLLAMDAPIALRGDSLRDEKLKVLRSLKPIAAHEVSHVTVRGQYVAGAVAGKSVEGYPRGPGPRPRRGSPQHHRNLRGPQSRNQQLAVGGRALLPPLRQAPYRKKSARSSFSSRTFPTASSRRMPPTCRPTSSSSASSRRKACA